MRYFSCGSLGSYVPTLILCPSRPSRKVLSRKLKSNTGKNAKKWQEGGFITWIKFNFYNKTGVGKEVWIKVSVRPFSKRTESLSKLWDYCEALHIFIITTELMMYFLPCTFVLLQIHHSWRTFPSIRCSTQACEHSL